MEKIETISVVSADCKEFRVTIGRDKKNRILVRKVQIICGIKVPLFETYALSISGAYTIQKSLVEEIQIGLN